MQKILIAQIESTSFLGSVTFGTFNWSVVFVCTSGISPAREPGDRVGMGRVIVKEQCELGECFDYCFD